MTDYVRRNGRLLQPEFLLCPAERRFWRQETGNDKGGRAAALFAALDLSIQYAAALAATAIANQTGTAGFRASANHVKQLRGGRFVFLSETPANLPESHNFPA